MNQDGQVIMQNQIEQTTQNIHLPLDDFLPELTSDSCSPQLQEKFAKFFMMKQRGTSLLKNLQDSHSFKNPAILERVINFVGIYEIGSNYPKDLYDPASFPSEDFFERLAEDQEKWWEQCEVAKQQRTQIEFAQGSESKHTNTKPTSKWDDQSQSVTTQADKQKPKPTIKPSESENRYAEYVIKKKQEAQQSADKRRRIDK